MTRLADRTAGRPFVRGRDRTRSEVGPRARGVGLLVVAALAGACSGATERLEVEVLRAFPHDTAAYTQGLIFDGGRLFESTGQLGSSTLRELDPATGDVLRRVALSDDHFGEGLALVDGRLIQLTWRSDVALVYDPETFNVVDTLRYTSDGWGLCHDGEWLWMSDGSSTLQQRDPVTFSVIGGRRVTQGGQPVDQLNELECVGEHIYANVYMTDRIVRIDKATGEVTAEVDASSLMPPDERPTTSGAVLNGIALDPRTGTFYLTGKLWPTMFEVRFVPAPGSASR